MPLASPRIIRSKFTYQEPTQSNAYALLFDDPSIAIPGDHVIYIDGTRPGGMQRTRAEHIGRVKRLATSLSSSAADGGVGIGSDERIGILSENSLVKNPIFYQPVFRY